MGAAETVAVYGATGHTGRFVVAELLRRGFVPVLVGRDAARLEMLAKEPGGAAARPPRWTTRPPWIGPSPERRPSSTAPGRSR
nr:hypothetical protein GCM10020093_015060 [Planobispora longispora]